MELNYLKLMLEIKYFLKSISKETNILWVKEIKNKFFNNTNGLKIELDVEDLAPSTYFLRLISESNLENIKFVKKWEIFCY